MSLALTTADWLALFGHFAALSLLAVGGAVTAAPEMHRYLVGERMWLSDAQFTSGFALAQEFIPTVWERVVRLLFVVPLVRFAIRFFDITIVPESEE